MCLGEVGQVEQVGADRSAEVRVDDRRLTVSLITLDGPVAAGDWLLVHSGFALEKLTAEQAAEAVRLRTPTQEEPP